MISTERNDNKNLNQKRLKPKYLPGFTVGVPDLDAFSDVESLSLLDEQGLVDLGAAARALAQSDVLCHQGHDVTVLLGSDVLDHS